MSSGHSRGVLMSVWSVGLALLASCTGDASRGAGPHADAGGAPPDGAPSASGGLIGSEVASELPTAWATDPVRPTAGPRATLVRWFTSGCPHCERSLPAIEQLRRQYEPGGLATIAVFHPKPARATLDAAEALRAARSLGYGGPVAVDADWSSLRRLWLDAGDRRATSISLLLDDEGAVRWVHPGPELFPSEEASQAESDASFRSLEECVANLLRE